MRTCFLLRKGDVTARRHARDDRLRAVLYIFRLDPESTPSLLSFNLFFVLDLEDHLTVRATRYLPVSLHYRLKLPLSSLLLGSVSGLVQLCSTDKFCSDLALPRAPF